MEEGNNKMVGTAVWDARRLVREYVKIAWMANDSIPFDELPWDNQIRVKRVAAVICAYLDIMSDDGDAFELIGRVFSSFDNSEVLKRSEISEQDETAIKQLLCQMSKEAWRMEHRLKSFEMDNDRGQLLDVLLRYRIATEELENTFSGVLESRIGAYIGINAVKDLYHPLLHECNDKVDDVIVLLLGKTFQRSFTERELIEKYNYPSTTDEELLDWRIDNF